MLDTVKDRKKAVYLSEQSKWEVAKYCIEHGGVVQGQEDGKFTEFRVNASRLALEINDCFPGLGGVTARHITESIKFYNLVAELTNNLPAVPAVQETVEMDMLKVDIARLGNELKASQSELMKAAGIINNYKERFLQIAKYAKLS